MLVTAGCPQTGIPAQNAELTLDCTVRLFTHPINITILDWRELRQEI